jgi:alpha-1,6-mannosyltransferase
VARPAQLLGCIAAAAITLSILLMAAVAAAGPNAAVAAIRRTWPMPPWWLAMHPSDLLVAAFMYAAISIGATGVACGLVAVRRGLRPAIPALLAGAAIAIGLLTVLPAAGSTDSISYAAYGRIAEIGHNPYVMTPIQLRESGDPVGLQTTRYWERDPSLYGPLATTVQWAAAELGGTSVGRIIFWLKLMFAVAFAAIAVTLDRLLRADPAARARAHLLWSVNPLMLWAVLGGAHIDGLAAALGVLGLIILRPAPGRPTSVIGPGRALAAGVLIGAAIAVKSPFAVLAIGLLWTVRRSAIALAAGAAGVAVALVPGYLLAGLAALHDLSARGGTLVTFDSFWRLFYPPFGYNSEPQGLTVIAGLCCLAMAALLAFRLPGGPARLPAIRPALIASMAWLFIWPLQRAWYDVMLFALLALFPATRLDWLVLIRAVPTTLDLVTAGARHRLTPEWLRWITNHLGLVLTPYVRLAAVAAVVLLCVTAAWNPRRPEPDRAGHPAIGHPAASRAMIGPASWKAIASRRDPHADGMAGLRRLLAHHFARPPGALRPEDQQGNGL